MSLSNFFLIILYFNNLKIILKYLLQNPDVFERVMVWCFPGSVVSIDKIFSLVVLHHREKLWSVFLSYPWSHRSFSVAYPIFLSSAPWHFHPLYAFFFPFNVSLHFLWVKSLRWRLLVFPAEIIQFPQCFAWGVTKWNGIGFREWNWVTSPSW